MLHPLELPEPCPAAGNDGATAWQVYWLLCTHGLGTLFCGSIREVGKIGPWVRQSLFGIGLMRLGLTHIGATGTI